MASRGRGDRASVSPLDAFLDSRQAASLDLAEREREYTN
jgi:hypothetical protein